MAAGQYFPALPLPLLPSVPLPRFVGPAGLDSALSVRHLSPAGWWPPFLPQLLLFPLHQPINNILVYILYENIPLIEKLKKNISTNCTTLTGSSSAFHYKRRYILTE